ncbi:MAG: elongation factor P [Oligoflexia bacterium]|nr:elongation factor P [Oligoflexia bacterium]
MASVYEVSDFKRGLKVEIDGVPWEITDFQHVKPGKGNAFTRTKLRNLITGANLEKTYKSGEKFNVPDLMQKEMQFLYKDESGFNFMDTTNYEQINLHAENVGAAADYLLENLTIYILFFNGKAIGIDLPNSVVLTIVETDPGVRGNTVSGGTKPLKLQTGLVINGPLHLSEGDKIKVDTRTNSYIEKMNK